MSMNTTIQLHDVVALLEDVSTKHAETGEALVLRRGQIGTVVLIYNEAAFEIEFSGLDGRPYAMLPIEASKLLLLYHTPQSATI